MIAARARSRESRSTEAYFFRSTMAHTLESLQPGTPVYCGDQHVGDVRAVYAEGESRVAELIVVHWNLGRDEDVALPTSEVVAVTDRGVELINGDPHTYATLATFDAVRYPTVHPLK